MTDHASPRVRSRTSYQNYLRPRKLIQDAIRVNKFSDVTRRQKARAVSAKILSLTKETPPLVDIEIEDYILTSNQVEHDHETLARNRRRKSLFKRTVDKPYQPKKVNEHPYRPKNHQEVRSAKKRVTGRRTHKKILNLKLVSAVMAVVLVGGVSLFWVGPRAQKHQNEVNAQLFDESMTVAGIPIDISSKSQVLGAETTAPSSGKNPAVIFIPALNISADIKPVGLNPNGTMPQAESKRQVAWYKASSTPEAKGTTLLTAYRDEASPLNLIGTLKNGDLIELRDANGEGYWYRVKGLEFYARRQVPMKDLVTVNKGNKVVIIVPNGAWDPVQESYSERIVVEAESVN